MSDFNNILKKAKTSSVGLGALLFVLFQVTLLHASEKPFFPVVNQTRNARGILSAYFNDIKPACRDMKQRSVNWFNTLSTPQKYAVGLGTVGASALVISGLYIGGSVIFQTNKQEAKPSHLPSGNPEATSSSSVVDPSFKLLTVQGLVSQRHKSRYAFDRELQGIVKTQNAQQNVVLQEAFACLVQNKSIGGDIRLNNIADLISCGANPFVPDAAGIPQFVHLAYEIIPEFLFSCLQAPALRDGGISALRPKEIKAGIKDSLVKLLGIKAELLEQHHLTNVFDTIISFVTEDVTSGDANKALGACLRFTTKDFEDVLVAAGLNIEDGGKRLQLAELVQTAQTPSQALREFVQKVHDRVLSPGQEDLCAFWFEQLRAGADPFVFEEGSSVNAFGLLAQRIEHELLISSLKAKVGSQGQKQRVFSDVQICAGVRSTLLKLGEYSCFDAMIGKIRAAITEDASGTFPESFLQDIDTACANRSLSAGQSVVPFPSSSSVPSIQGVQCSVQPQFLQDGSISAYKIMLGYDKEYICSDYRSLPAFIVHKLQNDFWNFGITEQAVKDFLKLHKILKSSDVATSNAPAVPQSSSSVDIRIEELGCQITARKLNGVFEYTVENDSLCLPKFYNCPAERLPVLIASERKIDIGEVITLLQDSNVPGQMRDPRLPQCKLEFGVPELLTSCPSRMVISCRITLTLDDRQEVYVVHDEKLNSSTARNVALIPFLQERLRTDFNFELSEDEVDDYVLKSGLRQALKKAYGSSELNRMQDINYAAWLLIAYHKLLQPENPTAIPVIEIEKSSPEKTALYYATLRKIVKA